MLDIVIFGINSSKSACYQYSISFISSSSSQHNRRHTISSKILDEMSRIMWRLRKPSLPWSRLSQCHSVAAVNKEKLSGNPANLFRGKKYHRIGDVLGPADPPHRDVRNKGFFQTDIDNPSPMCLPGNDSTCEQGGEDGHRPGVYRKMAIMACRSDTGFSDGCKHPIR